MGKNTGTKKDKDRQEETNSNLDKQLDLCDPRDLNKLKKSDLVARLIQLSGKSSAALKLETEDEVEEEESVFEDEEPLEIEKKRKKVKSSKKSPKISKKTKQKLEEEEEEEEDNDDDDDEATTKKKIKKSKNSSQVLPKKLLQDACEAIAIVYAIESERHPFHHLDGEFASVEIEEIHDRDKTDVKLFILNISYLNLFYIIHEKILKFIKLGKNVLVHLINF